MSISLPDKKVLTKVFLNDAGIFADDATIKKYLWDWWRNPISRTSLRLNEAGAIFLSETLKLQSYSYNLTDPAAEFTPKYLLLLDKYVPVPFYLVNRKKIVFYGEEAAIMLSLHGNSLLSYLNSLA